jgi:hypothetical protein
MWCALQSNGESPRKDAVLVMDDTVNFVSYIRPPYKLMLGFIGEGQWGSEPTGMYLYPNATFMEKVEEHLAIGLDYFFGSRDLSFFWHEVLHILIGRIKKRGGDGGFDFEAAGKLVLGSPESGDVMASTVVAREDIPLEVYDVYADPSETTDLSSSNPELVQSLLDSFNVHWKDHPKQFDWALSCFNPDRLAQMPQELCSKRTSGDKNRDMNQRAVNNKIPCKFEKPFVSDDDPAPCGTGNPPAINLKVIRNMTDIT